MLTLAREMFGTIKRHMLQEVSQATLARFLQDGAHTLGYIEVGKSCLLGIMTNVVSESVLQLALTDGCILLHSLSKQ